VSFDSRSRAQLFINSLNEKNSSTECPLQQPICFRDEIEECRVDPSSFRFPIHAKVFKSTETFAWV
jgi:hypothetical protein